MEELASQDHQDSENLEYQDRLSHQVSRHAGRGSAGGQLLINVIKLSL